MTAGQRFLLLLILVGALATVLGLVSKRARMLPYPVVLALAGVFVGLLPGTPLPHLGGDVLLIASVPGLVFEVTHALLGFSWASGMLLGAILAATDPIAVVTLLRRIGAPNGLASILEGESLLNDGTGVAAFTAVAGLRGALSVALALSVDGVNGVDSKVAVVAYGVVLMSLLVQGGLMAPVTKGLRIESAS